MSIKTILWPTDLSRYSREAIDDVVSLSNKYDAKVVVLYSTVDLCSYFPAYGNYPNPDRISRKPRMTRAWFIDLIRLLVLKAAEFSNFKIL